MRFKFKPVAWMTTILGVLTALVTLEATVHVVPDAVMPYVLGAITVLTAILGVVVHGKVTPLAAPKDDGGRPLVPLGR